MPEYDFSAEKNYQLIADRDISFEEVIVAISDGRLLDIIDHPDQTKYPGQKMYIVNMDQYVYMVPFVKKNEDTVFLKTIIPSRQLTKKYLRRLS